MVKVYSAVPAFKTWANLPTQKQLDDMKAKLPLLHAPRIKSATLKGLRIQCDGWDHPDTRKDYIDYCDYHPQNIWRIAEGFKRFEYVRPKRVARLASLPQMSFMSNKPIVAPAEIKWHLEKLFAGMKEAKVDPDQFDYLINEQYADKFRKYGMTGEMACKQSVNYRMLLNSYGLRSRKLVLCCVIATTGEFAPWLAFQELKYQDETFPRDVHFWCDPSMNINGMNHINHSFIGYAEAKQYQSDFICTEAGQWEIASGVDWGHTIWHDWNRNTKPLMATLIQAALEFGGLAYFPLFFEQTIPEAGQNSPGLWSNSNGGLTPKTNPILGELLK
jgi:hypothetical protein